jgi:hypothetical protein
VGATQTPFDVRILCTDLVTGLIHAASLLSSVMKPTTTVTREVERVRAWQHTWLYSLEDFLLRVEL